MRCLLEQEHEILEQDGSLNVWKEQLQEELDWSHGYLATTTARALKISPAEAQDFEVEKLLESLQAPLEVVHNVGLPEVKRYIDRWKESIIKEVKALVESGTVRRLSPEQVRELKRCGLTCYRAKRCLQLSHLRTQAEELTLDASVELWFAATTWQISPSMCLPVAPQRILSGQRSRLRCTWDGQLGALMYRTHSLWRPCRVIVFMG